MREGRSKRYALSLLTLFFSNSLHAESSPFVGSSNSPAILARALLTSDESGNGKAANEAKRVLLGGEFSVARDIALQVREEIVTYGISIGDRLPPVLDEIGRSRSPRSIVFLLHVLMPTGADWDSVERGRDLRKTEHYRIARLFRTVPQPFLIPLYRALLKEARPNVGPALFVAILDNLSGADLGDEMRSVVKEIARAPGSPDEIEPSRPGLTTETKIEIFRTIGGPEAGEGLMSLFLAEAENGAFDERVIEAILGPERRGSPRISYSRVQLHREVERLMALQLPEAAEFLFEVISSTPVTAEDFFWGIELSTGTIRTSIQDELIRATLDGQFDRKSVEEFFLEMVERGGDNVLSAWKAIEAIGSEPAARERMNAVAAREAHHLLSRAEKPLSTDDLESLASIVRNFGGKVEAALVDVAEKRFREIKEPDIRGQIVGLLLRIPPANLDIPIDAGTYMASMKAARAAVKLIPALKDDPPLLAQAFSDLQQTPPEFLRQTPILDVMARLQASGRLPEYLVPAVIRIGERLIVKEVPIVPGIDGRAGMGEEARELDVRERGSRAVRRLPRKSRGSRRG